MNKKNAAATKQFAAMKIAPVRRLYRRIRDKKSGPVWAAFLFHQFSRG